MEILPASLLIINLVVAIAIILACIMVFRWSPVVALICGSLYMGIACRLGDTQLETAERLCRHAAGDGRVRARLTDGNDLLPPLAVSRRVP